MPEFTGETEVTVFDLLTVMVMVEQCEPDLTVVTYYFGHELVAHHLRPSWRVAFNSDPSPVRPLPIKRTTCLACLFKNVSVLNAENGRARVLESIKLGALHITHIGPRSDTWRCPRCQTHLIPGTP